MTAHANGSSRSGSGADEITNGAAPARSSQLSRRHRALGLSIAAVVLSSALSWAAASRIRSPAEIAASTAPPAPSPISVPVENRVLASDVVVRGTVRYGAGQAVTLPLSALKKAGGLVTTAPVKGADLAEGSIALAVSGRPVFVLAGAQPAHRDMGPGASGEDVRQLEAALARLGFSPGPQDGVYDGQTEAAVAAWYKKAGWAPLSPSEEQLAAVRAADADRHALESERLGAEEAIATAERELTIAKQRAAALARVAEERASAVAMLAAVQVALQDAQADQRAADARLAEARKRQPPPSEEEEAALAKEAEDAAARVAVVQENLASVQAAVAAADERAASISGAQGPVDSKLEASLAQAEVDRVTNALSFARRRMEQLSRRGVVGPGTGKPGVQVPADEVLFFPTLPLRVDEAKLRTGDEVTGPVMTVTNSRLVVEAALPAGDAKLVRPGNVVAIRAPDLNLDATGTVSQVADTPGTNGVDPQRFFVQVAPAELSGGLAGTPVVLTITVGSTEGAVLAVPVAALSLAADGTTRVQVQGDGGRLRYVTVNPGLSAKGLVSVTPTSGSLAPGDLVIVGQSGAGRAADGKSRPAKP
jgi:peptidoglycan hydrolase-like protein with peptidoglycan-binding domain